MGILGKLFTWWDGATIGTIVGNALSGSEQVGTDAQGNRYYRGKKPGPLGNERRWVIYNGANDASRVPAEWHGWLHNMAWVAVQDDFAFLYTLVFAANAPFILKIPSLSLPSHTNDTISSRLITRPGRVTSSSSRRY